MEHVILFIFMYINAVTNGVTCIILYITLGSAPPPHWKILGSYPALYWTGTGGLFFPAVKRLARDANHWIPSTADFKNEWRCTSIPPYAILVCVEKTLPFLHGIHLQSYCVFMPLILRSLYYFCRIAVWQPYMQNNNNDNNRIIIGFEPFWTDAPRLY